MTRHKKEGREYAFSFLWYFKLEGCPNGAGRKLRAVVLVSRGLLKKFFFLESCKW